MERTGRADPDGSEAAPSSSYGTSLPGGSGARTGPPNGAGLLEALPRQRGSAPQEAVPGTARDARPVRYVPAAVRRLRPWRLLPTPTGTPFTFGYSGVLAVTSLIAWYASPAVVDALHQASSTDVAHLVRTPVLVLVASALWIAGGLLSPYAIGFLLVLTALERRIGGARTAGVFLLGHVLATLATEGAVGIGVLAGQLPDSSLHRFDYGVSFGVAACAGALTGLLRPWPARPLAIAFGGMLLMNVFASTDPMTDWGHLTAFTIGVATWPWARRWQARRRQPVNSGRRLSTTPAARAG